MTQRHLVTGGGFVGSPLVDRLMERGDEVFAWITISQVERKIFAIGSVIPTSN